MIAILGWDGVLPAAELHTFCKVAGSFAMGFRRSIVISSKVDDATRRAVLNSARERWPSISVPVPNLRLRKRILFGAPELTEYLFDTDEDYESAQEATFQIADSLPEFSATHRDIRFAYIDADCFGGTCTYSGFIAENGSQIHRLDGKRNGHRKLLRKVHIWVWWYFAPFERGYFDATP